MKEQDLEKAKVTTWIEEAEKRFIEKGWKKGTLTGTSVYIPGKHLK